MLSIDPRVKALIRYYATMVIIIMNRIMYSIFNTINIRSLNKSLLVSYTLFAIITMIDNNIYKMFGIKDLLMSIVFIKNYYNVQIKSVLTTVLLDDVVYYVYKENVSMINLFNDILSKKITIGDNILNNAKCKFHKSVKKAYSFVEIS